MRDPLTEDFVGHSVYAATRFDHLIDGYAVISHFVADHLINRFGVSADKIRVMYCGIDLNRFRVARRQRFPPDARLEFSGWDGSVGKRTL